ncbi:hydantoinase B/oxoprolinase family protein [soil metagenome]
MKSERRLDPITFEVIKNALDSIADQTAISLMRSAYSAIVRDSLDYSTAICDHRGRMLAQGLTTPLHLGSFPEAMRNVVEKYQGRMLPGDLYILNDPYGSGGMHLPDVYVIKPLFEGSEVVGYAATLAHHTDMGGIAPGSNAVHATEIFQEGLRIPLMKLHDAGTPNRDLLDMIERNVRLPTEVLGDLRAQVAGCVTAERGFSRLLERYGREELRYYGNEMLDHAERLMAAEITAMPDGVYEFTDHIDGLGEGPTPIRFHVKVTIAGSSLTADWTGTSPQVAAGINTPIPFTRSAVYLVMRSLAGSRDLPNNEGYMRPITVIAPEGTIVNSREPAAVASRGITGFRVIDTLLGALAQAVPDRVPAAGEGGVSWPTIGGYSDGHPFVYVESILGTWGARPNGDGTEGMPNPGANQSNQPVEMIEAELPLAIERYGFVADTGGSGRFRGGLALEREYRILAEQAGMTMRSDRRSHLPYGLAGGSPGTPSWNILNPGPDQRILPTLPMESVPLRRGDVFRHVTAGGGGYGDPLERDPLMVLQDVLDEKLTPAYAVREYGVVIAVEEGVIDAVQTDQLRADRRRADRAAATLGPAPSDQ